MCSLFCIKLYDYIHRFPHSNPERVKQWTANVRRENWKPSIRSRLCSAHFTPESFIGTGKIVRLCNDAIPTIFAFPEHLQKVGYFHLIVRTLFCLLIKFVKICITYRVRASVRYNQSIGGCVLVGGGCWVGCSCGWKS